MIVRKVREVRVVRVVRIVVVLLLAAGVASAAQFQRSLVRGQRIATEGDFDGRFNFCRLVYDGNRNGGSWQTDYPNADINLSIRFSELTKTRVAFYPGGEPKHLLVRATEDSLFKCPLIILTAPGSAIFDDDEVKALRTYLDKGGFIWADDFWGTDQWEQWETELRRIVPSAERPIIDLPMDHPLLRSQFVVTEIPQIPNIGFWRRSGGGTSERGADSETPRARIIADDDGQAMVLMTHNTDISDSWEREGEDVQYFYEFSPKGYALGINVLLYALTH
jgi:hypothetical protein